jgi:hypothetical protein
MCKAEKDAEPKVSVQLVCRPVHVFTLIAPDWWPSSFAVKHPSCGILGSHTGRYEDFYLLRHHAVYSAENHPTFRRNISPLFSGLKNNTIKKQLCMLPTSSWFLAWFILRPWRYRRFVSPKRRLTFSGLHVYVPEVRNLQASDNILLRIFFEVLSVWSFLLFVFLKLPFLRTRGKF